MEFNAERGAVTDADEEATAGVSVKADDPSLADMTRAALSILSKNEKGFFLLVEGGSQSFVYYSARIFIRDCLRFRYTVVIFSREFIMCFAFGG